MKRFLYYFLGSMAAIWLSVILGGLLILLTFAALVANSAKTAAVEDDSVLHISLSGDIVDRETPVSLLAMLQNPGAQQQSLVDILAAIREAKDDDDISGIFLDCQGASVGLAQAQAIIDALTDFRADGKFVYAYSDNYTQGDYFIATAADSLFLNPIGMADIHGLQSTTIFFKGLLDKLGVDVQVVKVGTYKSAVEPFILTEMSEANREQQTVFLGRIWESIAGSIAERRKVNADSVNAWANSFAFAQPAETYPARKIVDRLVYRHQVDQLLINKASAMTDEPRQPRLVSVDQYLSARAIDTSLRPASGKPEKNIAILYAEGDITESEPEGIASERLVPEILNLIDRDDIDGLILRVNSGGGSAFASEQIWEALRQFKTQTKKPFYVSMGDMAASGGYYISCGADRIYAEPLTLTGSIGIFGMIPDFEPLLRDKLGVNTQTVATNTGNAPTSYKAMTPEQRQAMQSYVDRGYELFTSRCAQGRHMSVDSIKAIAEGRVWDGRSALELGLVDKLGSLHLAVADMARALHVDPADVGLQALPEIQLEWWQEIAKMNPELQSLLPANTPAIQAAPLIALLRQMRNLNPVQARTNPIILR